MKKIKRNPDEKRTKRLDVRLSATEYAALDELSVMMGIKKSKLVRLLINDKLFDMHIYK